MKRAIKFLLLPALLFTCGLQGQEIMHYWHFNDVSGELDTVHADFYHSDEPSFVLYRQIDPDGLPIGIMDDVSGSDVNARLGFDAGNGIRPRNPSVNGELLITLNSEGHENLNLSYATERSGSGMLRQVLYYTVDGEEFIPFGDTVDITTSYELVNFDFSDIEEANDNPDFAVVIRFLEQNAISNGNNRFDNIVLEGDPISEPPALIHYWHFNEADGDLDTVFSDFFPPDAPSYLRYQKIDPDGDEIGVMDDVGGTSINARNNEDAGRGIRPRNPSANGELFIEMSTSGFSDILLSYASERTGSGMLYQVLYYTVDGENFQPFGDTVEVAGDYDLVWFDFSDIPEVDDNPDFAVRIRFLGQNTGDSGNNRFDNIALDGIPLGADVEGVEVDPRELTLVTGDSAQLTAEVLPLHATNREVEWSSEDETVATVTQTGMVAAQSPGTTHVIVSTDEGGFEDTATVEVIAPFELEVQLESRFGLVEGVEVGLNGEIQETGPDGAVVFHRGAGLYQLTVEDPDFLPLNRELELTSDTTISLHLADFRERLVNYWHFNEADGELDDVPADFFESDEAPVIRYQKIDEDGPDIGIMDDVGGTEINARLGFDDGRGIRPRNPSENGELLIELNSEGYEDLLLTYATERSGSGMLYQVLYYTTDGQNFHPFGDTIEVDTDYSLEYFDFSDLPEANNNPDFAVKIRFLGQNTGTSGNNRFDNIALEGNPIREIEMVHYWHFNEADGVLDTVQADYFSGTEPPFILYRQIDEAGDNIGIMDDVAGTDINARKDEPAGRGIRARNPSINGELLITLNSRGYEDLRLSYATERSGQGMLKQVLYYTTDGETFEPYGDTIDIVTDYRLVEFDFSDIAEANDNEDFAVVIRFLEQNTADNGNNRFDNVVLEGTPLEEPVSGVVINEGDTEIPVGETFSFTATVLPPGAENQEVSWRSEDESVATIDENGVATGVSAGFSDIIVRTDEGGFEDTVRLEVLEHLQIEVRVVDSEGALEDVEVTLDGELELTDQDGSVAFERVRGEYHLRAEKEGFIPFDRQVEIQSDTTLEINLSDFPLGLLHYWHFNGIPVGTIEEVEADYSNVPGDKPIIFYGFLPDYEEDPNVTKGYMDDYVNGSDLNTQLDYPAGAALRVRNRSEGRALIIQIPTTGAKDIVLTFDVHRSGQGMLYNRFEYTVDGINFSNEEIFPEKIGITEEYVTHTIDLTEVEGAEDNPNFAVRITYEGNTDQGNGNNRYDNIAVFGNSITSTTDPQAHSLKVFPNPSTGTFYVAGLEELQGNEHEFYLFDTAGKMVRSGTISQSGNRVEASGLTPGMYLMVVRSGDVELQEKVFISE